MSHALEFSALSKKCGETGIHMTFRTFFGSVHPGGLFFTPSMEEVRLVFTPSMEEVQESFDAIPNLARNGGKLTQTTASSDLSMSDVLSCMGSSSNLFQPHQNICANPA